MVEVSGTHKWRKDILGQCNGRRVFQGSVMVEGNFGKV